MSNLVRRSSRRLSQVLGQFKHRSKPSLTSDVTYGQDSQKSPVEGTNGATNGTTEATPALVTNGITNGTTNGITNGAQHDANLTTSPISVPTSPTIPEEPSTALGPTPNSLYEDATPDSVKSSKVLPVLPYPCLRINNILVEPTPSNTKHAKRTKSTDSPGRARRRLRFNLRLHSHQYRYRSSKARLVPSLQP